MSAVAIKPRFSGHQSFACRFSWLPKAVRLIESNAEALSGDEAAILLLGLGKNMVHSLRFWLDAFEIAWAEGGRWQLKPFGRAVLGRDGTDPYIERSETQWLLHWAIASRSDAPLAAWRHVFHRRMRPDFTRTELLSELRREGEREGTQHSDVTLLQHIDALLHSYVPTNAVAAPEDVLDGPLIDLKLIRAEGRRRGANGRGEQVFSLVRVPLSNPGPRILDYCIEDYWATRRRNEKVLSFRDIAYGEGSPGATLRLSEDDLRAHLDRADARYRYRASGDAGLISRDSEPNPMTALQEIYV